MARRRGGGGATPGGAGAGSATPGGLNADYDAYDAFAATPASSGGFKAGAYTRLLFTRT